MGGFHIHVENANRDVGRILTKAKVAADVIAECRECLHKLISISVNELDMKRNCNTLPATDVVSAVIDDLITNVCNVHIPRVQVEQTERENARLRHQISALKGEVAEGHLIEKMAEGQVYRLEEAQRYMMGTLFKEVTQLQMHKKMGWGSTGTPGPHRRALGDFKASSSQVAPLPTQPSPRNLPLPSMGSKSGDGSPIDLGLNPSINGSQSHVATPVHASSSPNVAAALSPKSGVPSSQKDHNSSGFLTLATSGGSTFDYSHYVSLIDTESKAWPERYRDLEQLLDKTIHESNQEKAELASMHRATLIEKEVSMEKLQDQYDLLLRQSASRDKRLKRACQTLQARYKNEIQEIKLAASVLTKEVQGNFATISREVEMMEESLTFFVTFVEHTTMELKKQLEKVAAGDRVRRAAVPPFWRFFLLKGESDPDGEAKSYWQTHSIVKHLTNKWNEIIQHSEDISINIIGHQKEATAEIRKHLEENRLTMLSNSGVGGIRSFTPASGTGSGASGATVAAKFVQSVQAEIDAGEFRHLRPELGNLEQLANGDYLEKPEPVGKGWLPKLPKHDDDLVKSGRGSISKTASSAKKGQGGSSSPRKPKSADDSSPLGPKKNSKIPARQSSSGANTQRQSEVGGSEGSAPDKSQRSRKKPDKNDVSKAEEQINLMLTQIKKHTQNGLTHVYRRIVVKARKKVVYRAFSSVIKNALLAYTALEDEVQNETMEIQKTRSKVTALQPSLDAATEIVTRVNSWAVGVNKSGGTGSTKPESGKPNSATDPGVKPGTASSTTERPSLLPQQQTTRASTQGAVGGTSTAVTSVIPRAPLSPNNTPGSMRKKPSDIGDIVSLIRKQKVDTEDIDGSKSPRISEARVERDKEFVTPTSQEKVAETRKESAIVSEKSRTPNKPQPPTKQWKSPDQDEVPESTQDEVDDVRAPSTIGGQVTTSTANSGSPSTHAPRGKKASVVAPPAQPSEFLPSGLLDSSQRGPPVLPLPMTAQPVRKGGEPVMVSREDQDPAPQHYPAHPRQPTPDEVREYVPSMDVHKQQYSQHVSSGDQLPTFPPVAPPPATPQKRRLDDGTMRVAVVLPLERRLDGGDTDSDILRITSSSTPPQHGYVPSSALHSQEVRDRSEQLLLQQATRNPQINWSPQYNANGSQQEYSEHEVGDAEQQFRHRPKGGGSHRPTGGGSHRPTGGGSRRLSGGGSEQSELEGWRDEL